jgi:hypothetical protein
VGVCGLCPDWTGLRPLPPRFTHSPVNSDREHSISPNPFADQWFLNALPGWAYGGNGQVGKKPGGAAAAAGDLGASPRDGLKRSNYLLKNRLYASHEVGGGGGGDKKDKRHVGKS